jgi:hypothetical protein
MLSLSSGAHSRDPLACRGARAVRDTGIAVQKTHCSRMIGAKMSVGIRQQTCPIDFKKQAFSIQSKGRCAMARADFASLPQGNPCAQCSKPIALPDWVEAGPRRISYLWHCRACDYRFEAVAFFDEAQPEALAA